MADIASAQIKQRHVRSTSVKRRREVNELIYAWLIYVTSRGALKLAYAVYAAAMKFRGSRRRRWHCATFRGGQRLIASLSCDVSIDNAGAVSTAEFVLSRARALALALAHTEMTASSWQLNDAPGEVSCDAISLQNTDHGPINATRRVADSAIITRWPLVKTWRTVDYGAAAGIIDERVYISTRGMKNVPFLPRTCFLHLSNGYSVCPAYGVRQCTWWW